MLRLIYVVFILLSFNLYAQSPAQLQRGFIAEMQQQHGFDAAFLRQLFQDAELRQPILDAISRPAEKRLDWGQYRKIFISEKSIRDGAAFWRKHRTALQKASQQFGVPPEIMVAIIGVETRYGQNTGSYPVLDALYTLGFHYPKRAKFFRSELGHFLRLAREEGMDPRQPKGSYAGAMGLPQFIPSSYRHYAVDFDGDGKRDIWHNPTDAIGSVGNYFARHGWRKGAPITQRVGGVNQQHQAIIKAGYKPEYTVAKLRQSGIQVNAALPGKLETSLLEMHKGNTTEHWLGLHNFYVITRYNHSPLYAMAVYQLSEAVRAKYHE